MTGRFVGLTDVDIQSVLASRPPDAHPQKFSVTPAESRPLAKLYVSGPIKGQPRAEANFNHASDQLEAAGFDVVNPFDCLPSCLERGMVVPIGEGQSSGVGCEDTTTDAHYDHALRGDLAAMLACDGVALLDGWQASRGARLEQSVAVLVGIPVMPLAEWLA